MSIVNVDRVSVLRISGFCSVVLALSGCATTTTMPLARAQMQLPMRVLAMETPMEVDRDRLQAVLAPKTKEKLSVAQEPIADGVKHAQQHARSAMRSALSGRSDLIVVAPPRSERPFIDRIERHGFGTPLSQADADRLRTDTGADALLRFDITDYGLTPKAWRKSYITFEVASTLAIAGAIAYVGTKAAEAAAGAYLAQETAEETAEAYAGFWGLDVVCRPVRVEAELVRLHPVATVWTSERTGLSDVKLARLTRKVGADERNAQLDQATEHSVRDVVSALSGALKNIKPDPGA